MTSKPNNSADDELDRRVAAIARSESARAVADLDLDAELADFQQRLSSASNEWPGGDRAGWGTGRGRALVGAAAVVIVGLSALVIVARARDVDDPTNPATGPAPSATLPPATVAPAPSSAPEATTSTPSTTSTATSTSAHQLAEQLPVVVESDPPLIQPTTAVSVDKYPNGGDEQIWVATGSPEGYVVAQKGAPFLEIVGNDGVRRVEIDEQIVPLLVIGNVLYGMGEVAVTDGQPSARFVAVALAGANEGTVVAESLQGWVAYVELPVGAFARGSTGVVDQARDIGATVIDYVDEDGEPLAPLGSGQAIIGVDFGALFAAEPAVVTVDGVPAFRIQTDEATLADGMNGPIPAWSGNAGPHIAVLARDGSMLIATPSFAASPWVRIPAGWQLAAQGPDGPILVRDTGAAYEISSVDPVVDV